MNEIHNTLKYALDVARTNPRQALDILEASLRKARKSGDQRGVSLLARNSGILCTGLSDLPGAISYYEEALRSDPENASLYNAIGHVRIELGQ